MDVYYGVQKKTTIKNNIPICLKTSVSNNVCKYLENTQVFVNTEYLFIVLNDIMYYYLLQRLLLPRNKRIFEWNVHLTVFFL